MSTESLIPLVGNELTLVARVPKAGRDRARWTQVHFNRAVAEQFFRITPGDRRLLTLERIGKNGEYAGRKSRPLVYSASSNRNCKVELEFSPAKNEDYDPSKRPLVVMTEIDVRTFRYRSLMPGWPGYEEMAEFNLSQPQVGRGDPRVISTLDEVEMRWPQVGLRNPRI